MNPLYWRRPLLIVLTIACAIGLLMQRYVTFHTLGSPAIYWSLLPLTGIAALAAADWRRPEPQRVHDYCRTYLPWMIWLTAVCVYFSNIRDSGPASWTIFQAFAGIALLASWWMEWRFFADARKFALHRIVSFTLWMPIFVFEWPWSELMWRLDR